MLVRLAAAATVLAAATATAAATGTATTSGRGRSCANPWRVVYAAGRTAGDTRQVFLRVAIKGRQITVAWHANRPFKFCYLKLTEARGQIFSSTNPSASYSYTDTTPNHSNGIKALTATSRNP